MSAVSQEKLHELDPTRVPLELQPCCRAKPNNSLDGQRSCAFCATGFGITPEADHV